MLFMTQMSEIYSRETNFVTESIGQDILFLPLLMAE